MTGSSAIWKSVSCPLQGFRITNLEGNCLGRPQVFGEHQRVIAKIRSEGGLGVGSLDEFETQDALCKINRGTEIARAEPDVSKLFYCNHWWLFFSARPQTAWRVGDWLRMQPGQAGWLYERLNFPLRSAWSGVLSVRSAGLVFAATHAAYV